MEHEEQVGIDYAWVSLVPDTFVAIWFNFNKGLFCQLLWGISKVRENLEHEFKRKQEDVISTIKRMKADKTHEIELVRKQNAQIMREVSLHSCVFNFIYRQYQF